MDKASEAVFHQEQPLPCPECKSNKGFHRVGKFRSQCSNCNALVSNSEIGRDNQDEQ